MNKKLLGSILGAMAITGASAVAYAGEEPATEKHDTPVAKKKGTMDKAKAKGDDKAKGGEKSCGGDKAGAKGGEKSCGGDKGGEKSCGGDKAGAKGGEKSCGGAK
jgi:hypothetical protein